MGPNNPGEDVLPIRISKCSNYAWNPIKRSTSPSQLSSQMSFLNFGELRAWWTNTRIYYFSDILLNYAYICPLMWQSPISMTERSKNWLLKISGRPSTFIYLLFLAPKINRQIKISSSLYPFLYLFNFPLHNPREMTASTYTGKKKTNHLCSIWCRIQPMHKYLISCLITILLMWADILTLGTGKSSWPELVGVKAEVAKATIVRENPKVVDTVID